MARRGLQATTKLNRQDYGLKWSKTVEAGPVVGDEITVEINAELTKSAPAQKAGATQKATAQPAAAKK
jgi:hypothetical protein